MEIVWGLVVGGSNEEDLRFWTRVDLEVGVIGVIGFIELREIVIFICVHVCLSYL